MGNIAKVFFVAVFAFAFFSCDRTRRDNQNAQLPQDADSTVERFLDMTEEEYPVGAVHQTMDDPELAQALAEEVERTIGMTLIPSVEPELLRNVMPNSWHRLERLTEDEERAFLRENANLFLQIERDLSNARLGFGSRSWHDGMWHRRGGFDYFSIHRQKIGSDTFHRIIVTANSTPDFTSRSIWFVQFLVNGNILLGSAPYTSVSFSQWGFVGSFSSIDIISGKEGARGILITEVSLAVTAYDYDWNDWIESAQQRNDRLFGHNESRYYFLTDLLNGIRSPIKISASDSLVDPDSPLRYSLQNAFDGDPSTSFVANAQDELLSISIGYTIRGIAIINGHTRSVTTCISNNYLRSITTVVICTEEGREEKRKIELVDDILSWQIIENAVGWFTANEVYLQDNCRIVFVTEFNVFSENYGWLFGDIDG